jgi:hypothetical protein
MLSHQEIHRAFAIMGDALLRLDHDVEILVVGGAAGVLSGELPGSWTTGDVDVIHCQLPNDHEAVMDAAEYAAKVMNSLPSAWFSEDARLFSWQLRDGWESRRVLGGQFGRLKVFSVGRIDLIAMKFAAGRGRDREHLALMKVTESERKEVREWLAALRDSRPDLEG